MAKADPKKTQRLGRGLNSIVTKRPATSQRATTSQRTTTPTTTPKPDAQADAATGEQIVHLPLTSIIPNPNQPRQHFNEDALAELADSIRLHGLMQPVVVRPTPDGQHQLIAGERRWRAAQKAGLSHLPAIIRKCSDAAATELALVENLQREDLNAIERAQAYRHYLTVTQATIDQLAERLCQSRPNITNYLRLLHLPQEIQEMVANARLPMGQARAISGLQDPERQLAIARQAVRKGLSTRDVENLAKAPTPTSRESAEKEQVSPDDVQQRHLSDIETTFSRAIGTAVTIAQGRRKNSGRIVIHYRNLDEFDRIAQRLGVNDAAETD